MDSSPDMISEQDILAARPGKHRVDPERPYAFLVEQERSARGEVVDVATLFLTNRECPFRCLMCDLWQNTIDERASPGSIPRQIDFALERLPPARQIKLYNSGNFFDAQAVPASDAQAIAARVHGFDAVIVENHPRLCSRKCVEFKRLLEGRRLEIALGLETIHPRVLPALNKQMTLDDFSRAVEYLLSNEIAVRAFVLLKPPFLSERQGVEWAIRSIEYAFSLGVGCCSIIPTRAGNGIMDQLQQAGRFTPPTLLSAEEVLEAGLRLDAGRVFLDLWEIEQFARCPACRALRRERLHHMNLSQRPLPKVPCGCEDGIS